MCAKEYPTTSTIILVLLEIENKLEYNAKENASNILRNTMDGSICYFTCTKCRQIIAFGIKGKVFILKRWLCGTTGNTVGPSF